MRNRKKTPMAHEVDETLDMLALIEVESPADRRYTVRLKMDGTYEALGRPTFKQLFDEVERGIHILPARSPA